MRMLKAHDGRPQSLEWKRVDQLGIEALDIDNEGVDSVDIGEKVGPSDAVDNFLLHFAADRLYASPIKRRGFVDQHRIATSCLQLVEDAGAARWHHRHSS